MERVSSRKRRGDSLTPVFDVGSEEPLVVADDGLHTQDIKPHSLEKIRIHNRYSRIFTSAMRPHWPQLAYIGLYSGCGRAKLEGTERIYETSALSVLRQHRGFTHHIFVDNESACTSALRDRCEAVAPTANVRVIGKDVNESAGDVLQALPDYGPGNGLLSFCFVDPFDTTLRFSTMRTLSRRRVDFLVLLMTGFDFRLNFRTYFDDTASTRIGDLIDCPGWRNEYRDDGRPLRFLLRKFDEAMQHLGYPTCTRDDSLPVYAQGTGVLIYNLVFYSKSDSGRQLWRRAVKSLRRVSPQGSFNF